MLIVSIVEIHKKINEKEKKKKNKKKHVGWDFLKGSTGMLLKHVSKPLYSPLGVVFLYSRSRRKLLCKLKSVKWVSECYPLEFVLILFAESGFWFLIWNLANDVHIIQLPTFVDVDMKCYWTVNFILTDAKRRSVWIVYCSITLHVIQQ